MEQEGRPGTFTDFMKLPPVLSSLRDDLLLANVLTRKVSRHGHLLWAELGGGIGSWFLVVVLPIFVNAFFSQRHFSEGTLF